MTERGGPRAARWWGLVRRRFVADRDRVRLPAEIAELVREMQVADPPAFSGAAGQNASLIATEVLKLLGADYNLSEADRIAMMSNVSKRRRVVVVNTMGTPSPVNVPSVTAAIDLGNMSSSGVSMCLSVVDQPEPSDCGLQQPGPWDTPGADMMAVYWTWRFREAEQAV
jgi:hypothetical protein